MNEKADRDYEEIWKPLLMTNGAFDPVKIKNEMTDLIFVFHQIGKVYSALTGGTLSKPNYYADTIISLHEDEIQRAYDDGYKDCKDDYEIKD